MFILLVTRAGTGEREREREPARTADTQMRNIIVGEEQHRSGGREG